MEHIKYWILLTSKKTKTIWRDICLNAWTVLQKNDHFLSMKSWQIFLKSWQKLRFHSRNLFYLENSTTCSANACGFRVLHKKFPCICEKTLRIFKIPTLKKHFLNQKHFTQCVFDLSVLIFLCFNETPSTEQIQTAGFSENVVRNTNLYGVFKKPKYLNKKWIYERLVVFARFWSKHCFPRFWPKPDHKMSGPFTAGGAPVVKLSKMSLSGFSWFYMNSYFS